MIYAHVYPIFEDIYDPSMRRFLNIMSSLERKKLWYFKVFQRPLTAALPTHKDVKSSEWMLEELQNRSVTPL